MAIASLAGKLFAEKAIAAATRYITPLKDIAHRFDEAMHGNGDAITVPLFEAGEAQEFHDDYTAGADSASGIPIPLDKHFFKSKVFTDRDFQQCPVAFWQGAGIACGRAVGLKIDREVLGHINKTEIPKSNSGSEVVWNSFAKKSDFSKLSAYADALDFDPAESVLVLGPTPFAELLSLLDAHVYGGTEAVRLGMLVGGLYGFAGVVRSNSLKGGAENLNGAIVHRDAIGYAGAPLYPQSTAVLEEHGLETDPESGLVIGIRRWGDAKSGKNYMTAEALFGAKLLQPKKIVRLVSGATA